MTHVLDQAIAAHRAGALARAEILYREVLASVPGQADAARLLGLLLHQAGRGVEAVAVLEPAAKLHRRDAALRDVLGVALKGLGRTEAAVAAFRAAARLDANAFGPRYNLGNVLRDLGDLPAAEASFLAALKLDRAHAWAWHNLADVQRLLGDTAGSVASSRQAVALAPGVAVFRLTLAACLAASGEDAAAAAELAPLLQAEPDNAAASRLRAQILARLGDPGAAQAFDEALRLAADDVGLLTEAALFHQNAGAYHAAEPLFHRVACLAPDQALAQNNHADVLRHLGWLAESETAFRAALRRDPALASARYGLALTLLSAGRYAEGWEAYESRWQALGWTNRFTAPPWDGAAAPGQTLLIHAEQGFGDMIQMARYFPLAAARAATVIVEAPSPLVRLFAAIDGVSRVIPFGDPLPPFDQHCPAMSLPRAFATTVDTIPRGIPYLRPEDDAASRWAQRLAALPGRRIGLVWGTGARFAQTHLKSVPAEALAPLASVPGVSYVSLQKDPAGAPPLPLHDWTADLTDFAETAALTAGLDLVITPDTAVAHLAAALGRPVWLLAQYAPDWRWRRDPAAWYPTLRFFGQEHEGDWPGVIARVAAALIE